MVFLFQMQTVAKKQAREVPAFNPNEKYVIDFSKNNFKSIGITDSQLSNKKDIAKYVTDKKDIAKYVSLALISISGYKPVYEVTGNTLNIISQQAFIDKFISNHNKQVVKDGVPDFEKLPTDLSSTNVKNTIKEISEPKYEKIKNYPIKKTR